MWNKTSDKLPTEGSYTQVKVIMYTKGWATSIVGMLSSWRDDSDRKWSQYDPINDRYYDFPHKVDWWMLYPEKPE